MTNLASARLHTDALLELVTSVPVGDGEAPANVGWTAVDVPGQTTFVGYAICHPISQTSTGDDRGTIAEPDEDTEFVWQFTCVGATRQQCEAVIDLIGGDIIGQTLEPVGRTTSNRIRLQSSSGGARRDDETQPPLWSAAVRFVADSTPA